MATNTSSGKDNYVRFAHSTKGASAPEQKRIEEDLVPDHCSSASICKQIEDYPCVCNWQRLSRD